MLPERKWVIDADSLNAPLRSRKAYRWMTADDLFHEAVPDDVLDRVFAVMALCPQHTFQVLTKRSARARAYLSSPETLGRVIAALQALSEKLGPGKSSRDPMGWAGWNAFAAAENLNLGNEQSSWPGWPLKSVWLGVSVEDQRRADERIPDLLATPAAVRWISAEPLLGPVDLGVAWHGESALDAECWGDCGWCKNGKPPLHNCQRGKGDWEKGRSGLDWVVVGGESGPGARPVHPDWVRSLRDQCAGAGVSFFMKQLSGPRGRAVKDIALFPEDLQVRETPNAA